MGCMNFYENIYNYLYENYVKDGKYEFIFNPILSDENINGEGDILLYDKSTNKYIIVDIKVTGNQQFNIEHLLQLMLYTHLLRKENKIVEYAMVLNPLLGREEWINLSKWNKGEELINYLIHLDSVK
jgi:predicted RecB family nuclease